MEGVCVRAGEGNIFVDFRSQPESCVHFGLDYQGGPHPVFCEPPLVGSAPPHIFPRKLLIETFSRSVLLFCCPVHGSYSPSSSSPHFLCSVFTVGQVTFFPDIFSVVQLDKVKVKATGNFVWANHIYLVSLN